MSKSVLLTLCSVRKCLPFALCAFSGLEELIGGQQESLERLEEKLDVLAGEEVSAEGARARSENTPLNGAPLNGAPLNGAPLNASDQSRFATCCGRSASAGRQLVPGT